MNFQITDCVADDVNFILHKMMEYNFQQVPKTQEADFIDISRKIINENGQIIAGCVARMYCWKIVYLDILWVDGSCRQLGMGTQLLKEIEAISIKEGCSLIHLDTFDFQAKDFYLRQGYEIFGMLEDCPPGHTRYYLKKKLV